MKDAIVLYPSPAIGHLISMVELGKLVLTHRPSLSIHILISGQAYSAGPTSAYISTVKATTPSITFHHLPPTSLPTDFTTSSPHHETLALNLIRLNNPNVHHALLSISAHHRVHALIIDFFCYFALPVAKDLSIPCYCFFTSGAVFLSFFMYSPIMHHKYSDEEYSNPKTLLEIPGTPHIRKSEIAMPLQDRTDDAYKSLLESAIVIQESAGIIVNTFQKLEERTIKAIIAGECAPCDRTPPVYNVGPLISRRGTEDTMPETILSFLKAQPKGSVVFLCFGSLGAFSVVQLREIAVGLERSQQRFLWVVRNPPPDPNRSVSTTEQPDPDLESLLPDGFLDRTKERGLVVKKWAPQVPVLNHGSVGGFVTHCGWNSVLEAVVAGVPMIAWPLYAEQGHNRVAMVEEMKIAVAINESENGFVAAEEVEDRVRELMDSEVGESMRRRILALRDEAKASLSLNGPSYVDLAKLTESWTS